MWKTAFRFMVFDKTKLIGILFGITVSIFLVGVQLGYLDSVLDTFIGIVKDNTEYIFVVDKKSTSSVSLVNIDKRVGYELQSIKGVEKVYPVIVAGATSKFKSGATGMVTIIGVDLPGGVGGPKHFTSETNLNTLQNEGAVIVDITALEDMESIKIGDYFSINDIRVYVSGISLNNQNLGQPNIITTIERVRQISKFSANHVSAYILRTNSMDTAINDQIVRNINSTILAVNAFTGRDFNQKSLAYVKETSSIMSTFMFLIGFSLITGFIVVGLTMFSSVNDRIKDYGTIKAIGGTNAFITRLILSQSVLYALIGFGIAISCLLGLKILMASANQTINLSPSLIAFLFLSTLTISLVGSYFSLRKILKLEPVQIFRM